MMQGSATLRPGLSASQCLSQRCTLSHRALFHGLHSGKQQLAGSSRHTAVKAMEHLHMLDSVSQMVSHFPMAEMLGAPCQMMKCGDVIHRSTLDPVLRMEEHGLDWRGIALLASVAAYLFISPGVLPGAIDYYILSPLAQATRKVYTKDDIILGKKLAEGGFGTVYRAELKQANGKLLPVIVKKAKEFGEAEVWMNERMMRLPGKHCAELIADFEDTCTPAGSKVPQSVIWLVWKYEGDNTLYDLMAKKDFPYNLEPLLLSRELKLPKGARRKMVTIKMVMKQMVEALACLHNTGIVHRDVKPQNCIISEDDKKLKLIDLGGAADLRIGINYVPNEYLLDPRYAPPQMYVMSTQTPKPPPKPVAAFLSPVLWRMEKPDKFDMYSVGVTMLQLAFAPLRNDNVLIAFNKRLQGMNYDLQQWRREEERKGVTKDMADGFTLLDLDDKAGWELVCTLMAKNAGDRPSAQDVLKHPWLTGNSGTVEPLLRDATKAVGSIISSDLLNESMFTGTRDGGLSEAMLSQEFLDPQDRDLKPLREGSQTIAWWQQRQALQRKVGEGSKAVAPTVPAKNGGNGNGAKPKGAKPSNGAKSPKAGKF